MGMETQIRIMATFAIVLLVALVSYTIYLELVEFPQRTKERCESVGMEYKADFICKNETHYCEIITRLNEEDFAMNCGEIKVV